MRKSICDALDRARSDISNAWISEASRRLEVDAAFLRRLPDAYVARLLEQKVMESLRLGIEDLAGVGEQQRLSLSQAHELLFLLKDVTIGLVLGQDDWPADAVRELDAVVDAALREALRCYDTTFEARTVERALARARNHWITEVERGRRAVADLLGEADRSHEQLRVKEELLDAVVRDCADAIITVDTEGTIQSWNTGAENLFKYTRAEVVGRPVALLIPSDLLDRGEWEFLEREVRTKGSVRDYETERLAKDGRRIRVSVTRTVLRDTHGHITGTSAIVRDITDRRALEMQLAHADRLATMGTMAAGLAHEIGNPLGAISSLVQVMQRRIEDPDVLGRLDLVRQQVKRITSIVREMADFSRPNLQSEPQAHVGDVVRHAVTLARYSRQARRVEVVADLDRNLPPVAIATGPLLQVFLNLVLNAYDAMRGEGCLRIEGKCNSNAVEVKFADSGPGVPTALRERIFEPFFTTKAPGHGTGMGLPVSQRIVHAHGGTMAVGTAAGGGAVFTVALPIPVSPGGKVLYR